MNRCHGLACLVVAGALMQGAGLPVQAQGVRAGLSFRESGQALGEDDARCVALADVEGDGDQDILVTSAGAPMRLWLNDGSGSFSPGAASLPSATCLAVGDMDADGDPDLVLAGGTIRVLLNDGAGSFSEVSPDEEPEGGESVSLGDLDGDGDLDALVVRWGAEAGEPDLLFFNDGQGHLTDSGQFLGEEKGAQGALLDMDGDGDLDLLVANQTDPAHYPAPNTLWWNDGRGVFTGDPGLLVEECSYAVALGDLDGDGDDDAVVANASHAGADPANTVWINGSAGAPSDSGQRLGRRYTLSLALGDLDLDGDLDVYFGNHRAPDEVWLNDGHGTFIDSGLRLGDWNTHGVALGDLDGDGDLDAVVVHNGWMGGDPTDRIWLNTLR